jgi:hypothetical protein
MHLTRLTWAAIAAASLAACGGNDDPPSRAATPATLTGTCASLATRLASLANTTLTSTTEVAAGALSVAGQSVAAHCLVTGSMYPRTGIDNNAYAIGFEMRLPINWNGRFFYQGNGGIDGNVSTATGAVSGGGALTHALHMGFAVISSDAGHAGSLGPNFGVDPPRLRLPGGA